MNLCAAAHVQALCEEYSDEMTSWLALTDRLSKEVSCSVGACTPHSFRHLTFSADF